METIVLATKNRGKLQEFKQLSDNCDFELVDMASCGLTEDIVENGKTYRDNALIKAKTVYAALGRPVLADDSGLSVDLLEGAPGIYSARFAGALATDSDKIERLWEMLSAYPDQDWHASFVCTLCYMDREGKEYFFTGKTDGIILPYRKGSNGFGYDPIFYIPDKQMTTAEMTSAEKNKLSHRGRAMRQFIKFYQEAGGIL